MHISACRVSRYAKIDGEGDVDGVHAGGHIHPANLTGVRDRRLSERLTGRRRVVITKGGDAIGAHARNMRR